MMTLMMKTPDRRYSTPGDRAGFSTDRCFSQNPDEHVSVIKIISGQWHVCGRGGEMLTTILGSCVSACIRDTVLGIGGMNHFLLPGDDCGDMQFNESARYGAFAMECLINGLLNAGAQKSRFEIKVFGGGNVINNSAQIGSKNAAFIRAFLHREGYAIASEDLEGNLPRRVHYYPDTGKVMVRQLRRHDDLKVIDEEDRYKRRILASPIAGEVELF
jgi:chemotaxis protein CheD